MAEMNSITLNGKKYEIPKSTTVDPTTLANLHVWRRAASQGSGGYAPSDELETAYTWIHDSSSVSPVTRFQGQYADAVAVTDGVLGLVDPVSIPTVYTERDAAIPGKYITAKCKDDDTAYIYLVPTGDDYSSLSGTTTYATGEVGSWVRAYRMVETEAETSDAVYICAESADAYSGDGYEYLGRLGDAFESGAEVFYVQFDPDETDSSSVISSHTAAEIKAAYEAGYYVVGVGNYALDDEMAMSVFCNLSTVFKVGGTVCAEFSYSLYMDDQVTGMIIVLDYNGETIAQIQENTVTGVPAYTEADYGKFLSPSADGLVWVDAQSELPNAEEAEF